MTDTVIDLLRHGEPQGGRAYRGHGIDDPLTEKGWAQMWNAVGDASPWGRIVSSPLVRCRAFAEAVGERHGIPVQVEDDLKEVGFGTWEGQTPQSLQADRKAEYEAFYADPVHCRPEGAEDLDVFIGRVAGVYERLLEDLTGEHCLLVAHAGVIRAVLATALQAAPIGLYRIQVANGGVSRIRHNGQRAMVEFVNGVLPER